MGVYATTTALDTLMIGVTFDSATSAMATKAIEHAEAMINSYIGNRYNIAGAPFQTTSTIPPKIKSLAEQISEGWVWTKSTRGSGADFERGKELRREALVCLESIRDYKLNLFDSSGSIITEKTTSNFRVQSNTVTFTPTFGEDDPLDWEVDRDKLQDISDSRD